MGNDNKTKMWKREIRKFSEKQLKKRYNVTLDEREVERLKLFTDSGLSPTLQYLIYNFNEDYEELLKDENHNS